MLAVQSCGSPANADKKTELKTAIKDMEDSLTNIESDPMKAAKIPSLTNIELINRLLAYYHAFTEDTFSSDCLVTLHM